jgi:hypothetical protein
MEALIFAALFVLALLGLVAANAGHESRDGFDGNTDAKDWSH